MSVIEGLCKRRGFIYRSSEIYGGFNGFFDFGPLGVELKNNIKRAWWKELQEVHQQVIIYDLESVGLLLFSQSRYHNKYWVSLRDLK